MKRRDAPEAFTWPERGGQGFWTLSRTVETARNAQTKRTHIQADGVVQELASVAYEPMPNIKVLLTNTTICGR